MHFTFSSFTHHDLLCVQLGQGWGWAVWIPGLVVLILHQAALDCPAGEFLWFFWC